MRDNLARCRRDADGLLPVRRAAVFILTQRIVLDKGKITGKAGLNDGFLLQLRVHPNICRVRHCSGGLWAATVAAP